MSQALKPQYPECRKCPFYQYQECMIQSSRILTYFYCPVSEGYRGFESVLSRRNGTAAVAQAHAG